jgi:hypothetical protein
MPPGAVHPNTYLNERSAPVLEIPHFRLGLIFRSGIAAAREDQVYASNVS